MIGGDMLRGIVAVWDIIDSVWPWVQVARSTLYRNYDRETIMTVNIKWVHTSLAQILDRPTVATSSIRKSRTSSRVSGPERVNVVLGIYKHFPGSLSSLRQYSIGTIFL
jgi:hypothetical protein